MGQFFNLSKTHIYLVLIVCVTINYLCTPSKWFPEGYLSTIVGSL